MEIDIQKRDLLERTQLFAERTKEFVKKIPKTLVTVTYIKQLIRSSSSVAANYIEAREACSRKDFIYRLKVCRKEAKESLLWLRLLNRETANEDERLQLHREAHELTSIFIKAVKSAEQSP
jgi:four helix bundle protein